MSNGNTSDRDCLNDHRYTLTTWTKLKKEIESVKTILWLFCPKKIGTLLGFSPRMVKIRPFSQPHISKYEVYGWWIEKRWEKGFISQSLHVVILFFFRRHFLSMCLAHREWYIEWKEDGKFAFDSGSFGVTQRRKWSRCYHIIFIRHIFP